MIDHIIGAAFEARLKAWAAARVPPLPVAYDNNSFAPPSDSKYVAAYLMPTRTSGETLDGLHRAYEGIFQVNIVQPAGVGAVAARLIAADIDALYPTFFDYGGIRIFITEPMVAATGKPEGGSFTLPISCKYRVDKT